MKTTMSVYRSKEDL